ncbi:hypothetical protein TNCV_3862361 [Trichonephila clavipes]|uniref:Uncharacterized protein n=1 Tax=Trichonephila clavipes TaxID=2585209 RepID=A0A8X6VH78_TRICX|nr:hypothetical protein TNCV_3862361 [Trichonephila clavipes]
MNCTTCSSEEIKIKSDAKKPSKPSKQMLVAAAYVIAQPKPTDEGFSDPFKQIRCDDDRVLCHEILHSSRQYLMYKRFQVDREEEIPGTQVRGAWRQNNRFTESSPPPSPGYVAWR